MTGAAKAMRLQLMAGLQAGIAAEPDETKRQMAQGALAAAVSAYRLRREGKPVPAELAPVVERAKQIKAKTHDIQIAVGVDRLDYTKGIPERLKAFGNFLRNYPEFHRKVELIQIVVPSREGIPRYNQLKREVERLVTHVNGEFSEPGWVPINYIYRSVPREELVAIYRAADVALITCLKDGMNLVAKEYCAAKTQVNGVLVLSEFAGAAPELRV